jgi:hypothetical protein
MMRRILWRASLLWACCGALLWWAALPAEADKTTVGTSAESWYQVTGCAVLPCAGSTLPVTPPVPLPSPLPAPVPTPSLNPFPAGTLHVGITAGEEQARTYIKLALDSIPFGAKLQGGTLSLPVADMNAGTIDASSAMIDACFMVQDFHGGDAGVVAAPPEPDCTTSAPAHLITQQNAQTFTVDLRPFAERWSGGETNNGIALLATEAAKAARATWEVAISGKGSAGPQIKAELNFTVPPEPVFTPEPAPEPVFVPPQLVPPPTAPVQAAPPVVQPPVVQPPVAITTHGFEYAAIFLLPLAGLAVSGLLGYSLTREVVLPDA